MQTEHAVIREALQRLQVCAGQFTDPGSKAHRFHTHPPLSEQEIVAFENRHRIQLPTDYRSFLIHVNNGGAGPYYGLFPLGTAGDSGLDPDPWVEDDGSVGVLSEPFPHAIPWNDLAMKPEYSDEFEDDKQRGNEYDRQVTTWEETYFNTSHVNGAIPICHCGCALRQWLVITGPEAGNVWCDNRADYKGLQPYQQGTSSRVTFLQWYRSWLDEALRQVRAVSCGG